MPALARTGKPPYTPRSISPRATGSEEIMTTATSAFYEALEKAAGGERLSMEEGLALSREMIDSGAARNVLEQLAACSSGKSR